MLRRRGRGSWCRPLRREHRLLVVGLRLALHERDGPGRACRKAVAQPVAVIVAQEPRLAAHQPYRPLMACVYAQPASVAGNLVYLHDRTDHLRLLRSPSLAASARSASREPPSAPGPVLAGASLPSHPPHFRCIYNIPPITTAFSRTKKRLCSPSRGLAAPQRRGPSARQLGSSAELSRFPHLLFSLFHSPARLLPRRHFPCVSAITRRPSDLAVPLRSHRRAPSS